MLKKSEIFKQSKLRICFVFVAGILVVPDFVNAQVTIGANKAPSKAALLDLKQDDNTTGGANSELGVAFPRVNLTDINNLYPMFTGSESDYATQKLLNKGLVVYNVGSNYQEGLYSWNGIKWVYIGFSDSIITANNGLTASNNNIALGGLLNANTVIESNNGNSLTFATNNNDGKLKVMSNTVGVSPKIELGADSNEINSLNENPELYIHSSANTSGKGGRLKFSESDTQSGMIIQHNTGEDILNNTSKGLFFNVLNAGLSNTAMVIDQQNFNIGIGTTRPDVGAALEVSSGPNKNKGFLLPKVSLSSNNDNVTIANPPKGLMVYNENPAMDKGEGLYMNYGDQTTPNWMGFLNNQPTSDAYNLGSVYVKSASGVVKVDVANGINNNIELGMEITLQFAPNTENLVMLNYSMPLGLTNSSTQTSFPGGYIGVRVIDGNGNELEDASRKVSISKPISSFFMSTVSGSSLQTIVNPSQTDKMTVTYKLKGYVENTTTTTINSIFNRWAVQGTPNYNWGNASMNATIYTRTSK